MIPLVCCLVCFVVGFCTAAILGDKAEDTAVKSGVYRHKGKAYFMIPFSVRFSVGKKPSDKSFQIGLLQDKKQEGE